MPESPELRAHREWLGYVQPAGIVASPPALIAAGAYADRNIHDVQRRLQECVRFITLDAASNPVPAITDLHHFFEHVCGWERGDLCAGAELPPELEVNLAEYDEALRPELAVRTQNGNGEAARWQMLIDLVPAGTDLDASPEQRTRNWDASPTARLERLCRELQVPIGLVCNGTHLRLLYAPRGETSGHMTFPVTAMLEVSGRPILSGLHMLLRAERMFSLPAKQRLPAIVEESRRYQAQVSTALSRQVLAALYELVRGFQTADEHTRSQLLGDVLRQEPDRVYEGLLTVLLRLVFLLYAEDRSVMPADPVYQDHYSIGGLFNRLREDAAHHPDTMDLRYGAWAQLLVLFRLVHDGGGHGGFRLPKREGYLFNPDRYPFLEARSWGSTRTMGERTEPPLISDGVVYRVLGKLLVLDGDRLSYRTLDVEQIGSVYETMMGFTLEVARGRAIAVKPKKAHGAPVTIDLDALLAQPAANRVKWLRDATDQNLTGAAAEALKTARTPEDVVAVLGNKADRAATPNLVPRGAMVLQPSDERRRSGTHYTPRSLTEPIVRTTLRPVLAALGDAPAPEQILDLKVLDPAMGSGAFLVEACRQLGEALVRAWHAHGKVPRIPSDEDELLHAMRMVAQRCIYGVDRNPLAADLGKLSLWLATLARDHAFTFIDHAVRHGDSLVGLTRRQIAAFHWEPPRQTDIARARIDERIAEAAELRAEIRDAGEDVPESQLRLTLKDADDAVDDVRLVGDLALGAFFGAEKANKRKELRDSLERRVREWLYGGNAGTELRAEAAALRDNELRLAPFHWEVEFPEVFNRDNPGFDAIVGNPPFAGKNTLAASNPPHYPDWLKTVHEESHGNADLVAHFYRRAFTLLRQCGCFGLIATNTIGQGDTRSTGLRWICTHGGTIYSARKRLKWPGEAAVVVSVVHVHKDEFAGPLELDGKAVPIITAYLFHAGGHENPQTLRANAGKSFIGSYVLGMGFTFDDTDTRGVASPIAEMHRLIAKDPRNAERIFPYIGGEEVNTSPTHAHHRYVINFGDMTEEEARRWPDLMAIVEEKVKPVRLTDNRASYRRHWWQYAEKRGELMEALEGRERALTICRVTKHVAFALLPTSMVFNEKTVLFPLDSWAAFAIVQSRVHELWARFFSSTLEDRLNYAPSDCFETFPFPVGFESLENLERIGGLYYQCRAETMARNAEGLTDTYNRMHDPEERSADTLKLRELHDAIDRAVLDAYGWTDIQPRCDFFLDYEDEDEEAEEEGARRRKKPWRYRWPDEVRDEVLARLLALNAERAEAERLAGRSTENGQ